MSGHDVMALSPMMALTFGPVAIMVGIAIKRSHNLTCAMAVGTLLLGLILSWVYGADTPQQITLLFRLDGLGQLFLSFNIIAAILVMLLGQRYMHKRETQVEEYYVLVLLAVAGSAAMCYSAHFASFYVGLEILSVSLYGLVPYIRQDRRATEAGLKYLILAGGSAAVMLFGIALIYAELGAMDFGALVQASQRHTETRILLLGLAMFFAGAAFKLSLAPFHLWTLDVYQGAPAPVTAFASTVSKMAVVVVLLRYFSVRDAEITGLMDNALIFCAAASMIVGNLMALLQVNIKRMLAASSIAHMGYLSILLLAGGALAANGAAIYLMAYSAAALAAFGAIIALSNNTTPGRDFETIEHYRGLFWNFPLTAAALAISMLSMAGIPLTAGFVGKFYAVAAGAASGQWTLLVLLAVTSVVGAYYYLRIIVLMCLRPEPASTLPVEQVHQIVPNAARDWSIAAATAATLWVGLYPGPVLQLIGRLTQQ